MEEMDLLFVIGSFSHVGSIADGLELSVGRFRGQSFILITQSGWGMAELNFPCDLLNPKAH